MLQLLSKPANRWLLVLIVIASALVGGIVYYGISQFGQADQSSETTVQQSPAIQSIVALGRLEPQTEVVRVSVPATLSNDRLAQLLVSRGEYVQANQVIAVLDSRERLERALLEAREEIRLAESERAQVVAGAKSGEIAAQRAEILRLQAELAGEIRQQQATLARLESQTDNARVEFERYQSLYSQGATSATLFDQRRLTYETAQAQLNEGRANQNRTVETLQAQISAARATLNRIAEVRPVDVETAQARVDQAAAAAKRAEADVAQATIRAPIAGQVLEVYTNPGEVVGNDGIVSLGQTKQMQVVAEVDQGDIERIRRGQAATITGESFSGEVRGTVYQVGLEVSRQEIFSNQPGENLDQRVVKVRVRLTPEDSKRVAGLTNLQVQVAIHL